MLLQIPFTYIASLLFLLSSVATGQSTDSSRPTPVGTNSIEGHIEPRDFGDSRLTQYYYSFAGGPGDLLITIESSDLDGDIDLFTANGLRPVTKLSIYTTNSKTLVSKTAFLRKQEPLILRIEARTLGDKAGVYNIKFGGAFIASTVPKNPAGLENSANKDSDSTKSEPSGGRRVNSIGARIDESVAEEVVTDAVTDVRAADKSSNREESGSPASEAGNKPESKSTERSTQKESAPARSHENKAVPKVVNPDTAAENVPRLSVRLKTGELVERSMSDVRSILVREGQLIIIPREGVALRFNLSDIQKFSIEAPAEVKEEIK